MDRASLDGLPAALARKIGTVNVAPALRVLFANLPRSIQLSATLPSDADAIPEAACQLVKLAVAEGQLTLDRLATSADAHASVSIRTDAREVRLDDAALARPIESLARELLAALLDVDDFIRALESFAFQSLTLSTLHTITRHMLSATDMDRALYVMLSGITSGYGLGFNRAALFLHDLDAAVFRGWKAIGPADATEAHRIWEELEWQDLRIEHLFDVDALTRGDPRFQRFVQTLAIAPGAEADDVVRIAMASEAPVRFERAAVRDGGLAALAPSGEFVLAAIRSHGTLLGLVFADSVYSAAPIRPEQLAAFGFFIDQTALVWENLSLLRRVEELARVDPLTGLFNRREFDARLAHEAARSARATSACSVLVLDLDHFKRINDRDGHAAGDDALRAIAKVLRESVRAADTVARLGGDEFVVLLPETGHPEARALATRLNDAARRHGLSLSIGGATLRRDCERFDELVAKADAQLYRAKSLGRDRSCFAESG